MAAKKYARVRNSVVPRENGLWAADADTKRKVLEGPLNTARQLNAG